MAETVHITGLAVLEVGDALGPTDLGGRVIADNIVLKELVEPVVETLPPNTYHTVQEVPDHGDWGI